MNDDTITKMPFKSAYFAAGCFWGVQYYFEHLEGVRASVCGYMGGESKNPTYEEVCSGISGHLEVVRVDYDKTIISYESLVKFFFEIHDFTQINGQGPDIGRQYLSAIFYNTQEENKIAVKLINVLSEKKYRVATGLIPKLNIPFFEAEPYHQNYYDRHKKVPYCHKYKQIF